MCVCVCECMHIGAQAGVAEKQTGSEEGRERQMDGEERKRQMEKEDT